MMNWRGALFSDKHCLPDSAVSYTETRREDDHAVDVLLTFFLDRNSLASPQAERSFQEERRLGRPTRFLFQLPVGKCGRAARRKQQQFRLLHSLLYVPLAWALSLPLPASVVEGYPAEVSERTVDRFDPQRNSNHRCISLTASIADSINQPSAVSADCLTVCLFLSRPVYC